MKKEYKRIKGLSKKIISREHFKKIKKIPDYDERTKGLKYLVASKLKLILLDLEIKAKEAKQKKALEVESKLTLLKSKIRIFESTHHKRDYKVIQKLIKEIESKLKCLE
jgi:hypothetical protein